MRVKDALDKVLAGEDLSQKEAYKVLTTIIGEEAPAPEVVAGLLIALRMKGETIEEFSGFVRAMRDAMVKLDVDVSHAVDLCGTGGDATGTFNISTTTMFVVAGAGVPVLKHGNRSVSSRSGSADVLEALGAVVTLPIDKVQRCYEQTNMAFMFAPLFHTAMKWVMPIRRALAVRTFFNVVGPLLNPAQVTRQLVGAYDLETATKMGQILQNVGVQKALTFHSRDGLDELSLGAIADGFEVDAEKRERKAIKAEVYGLKAAAISDLKGGDADYNANIIRDIVSGVDTGPKRDIIILNAGYALYLSGKYDSPKAGIDTAREVIQSGAAKQALDQFVQTTQKLADA